jgi:hypothetical protein
VAESAAPPPVVPGATEYSGGRRTDVASPRASRKPIAPIAGVQQVADITATGGVSR